MTTTEPRLLHPLVARVFAEIGVPAAAPDTLSEHILIQDGFYVGHRFVLGGWCAVWFTEGDAIDFFNPAGTRVRSCSVAEADTASQPLRRAA